MNTTSTGAFQVFVGGRVGNITRIKPFPFILNLNHHPDIINTPLHPHVLGGIEAIAMLDGIHEGLFEGQTHPKEILILELQILQLPENLFLQCLTRHRVAGDRHFRFDWLACGHGNGPNQEQNARQSLGRAPPQGQ